jgi:hydrogenase expression/formation protein HypE
MTSISDGPTCPIPLDRYPVVTLAHGGGGRLMNDLIARMFFTAFDNEYLATRHDAAILPEPGHRVAMTTDSYVVRPLVFPGGDIGCLGVYGTANDLAMAGAVPRYLSLGLILEEGLPMEMLWGVVQSIQGAACEAGVQIVTGDTKVVEHGKGDGIYLNTAGVGIVEHDLDIGPRAVRPGDVVIVSGDIGRHGIAIMAERDGLEFKTRLESDCGSVVAPVLALVRAGVEVHCLRDLTRGGLAAALHEIGSTSETTIELSEEAVPALEDVRGACEMLGLDPLHVACEGRFIAVVPADDADRALGVLRTQAMSAEAVVIGRAGARETAPVVLQTPFGVRRVVDIPSGEQLPRIC